MHEQSPTTPPTGRQYTIRSGDDHATIVELGGGLRSYVASGRELLDGFGEHEQVTSSRGQVLAPWPNRIDGGRYEFDGTEHQLALTEPARGNASHGLLRFVRWECRSHEAGEVVLSQQVLPQPGYPFALEVEARYRIDEDGLHVAVTSTNIGTAALPWAFGQHPYLAPPPGVPLDACTVELDAATWLATDERGIPLDARPVEETDVDLRAAPVLGARRLDTAYTDLARDEHGRAIVTLRAPSGAGTELWAGETCRWLQLFTGDTLAPERRRGGLAVEPMTAPANAFRTGIDLQRLESGERAHASWGMRAIDA